MTSEMQEIELEIKEAKALLQRKQSLDKLFSNREFKAIIVEHLFKEEAQRLASIIAEPQLAPHRAQIIAELDGISLLQQFFRRIEQQGLLAEQALGEAEAAREELLEAAAE